MAHLRLLLLQSSGIDKRYLDLAGEVGAELAAARPRRWSPAVAAVSCMGAVARAARRAGGHTIGVIPQALVDLEVADTDADELVVTADMRERKGIMDAPLRRVPRPARRHRDAGGAFRDLDVPRRSACMTSRWSILDPWGLYVPLRRLVDGMYDAGFTRPDVFDAISLPPRSKRPFTTWNAPAAT